MKDLACLAASTLLSACVIHVHVHEDAERAPEAARHARHAGAAARPVVVAGVVRDAAGSPVRARIAAVGEGGSWSSWTDDGGRFAVPEVWWPDFALHASTEDARVAIAPARAGQRDVVLVLAPGGKIEVRLEGVEKARCAVFVGELRVEDFTIEAGERSRVVVPSGEVRVRLYEGGKVYAERSFTVAQGATTSAPFDVGS